jgi:signal transduction histidine kinase/CheY-like chemotaxis protein
MTTTREACVQRLRRDFAVACDARGFVTWMDAGAEAELGALVGRALESSAAPGTEKKIRDLVAQARERRVDDWEIGAVVRSRPVTLAVRGEPCEDGFVLVASLLPEDRGETMATMGGAPAEIATLQRNAERDRTELAEQHTALTRAYEAIADSNEGVKNLHAELDERNASLRLANDVKGRVVANVSHEFRTPINSILGITRLLLDRLDGDLTDEQEKQLRFVYTSASTLGELVNDLLDLSRLEAGKHTLRTSKFSLDELLGGLRGMMKPLVENPAVRFVVEAPAAASELDTDQGKLSQILRNLVANALKFTERGEVRVDAELLRDGRVAFRVSDTGIGIAPENQARVFEEFSQIDSHVQRRVRGTGLGLSLSRRLAELLGGTLTVKSELGKGSVFTLTVPTVHEEVEELHAIEERSARVAPGQPPVLVIEDDRQTLFLYERYLRSSGFRVLPARTVDDARRVLADTKPAAIVLDVLLEGESTWRFLEELKASARTRDVPVMVVTVMDRAQKARALGADEFLLKPIDGERLIRRISEFTRRDARAKVLVIDDDEASRYLLRKLLAGTTFDLVETADGAEGVKLARSERPNVILLDFVLGEQTAFDVLDDLKADPVTRNIPVIIQTAKELEEAERDRLRLGTAAILKKQSLSRELAITRIREALVNAGVTAAPDAAHA